MQEYILSISENNIKSKALIEYLNTLEFIKLTKTNDWYDTLNDNQKESINIGLKEIDRGIVYSDEDARKRVHKRILDNNK